MKSSRPVPDARKLKIDHMKRIRAAYIQAKKDGTIQTRRVVVPNQSTNKLV